MSNYENELEVILGRLMYLKVIKELAISDEPLTKYSIRVRTGLKYTDIKKVIDRLIELGWLVKHDTKPEKYSLNYSKDIVKKFIKCMKELGYIPSK